MDSYDTVISQMIHEQNMADEAMERDQKLEDNKLRDEVRSLKAKVSKLELENESMQKELKYINQVRRANLAWGNL